MVPQDGGQIFDTHTLLSYAEDPGRAGAIVPMILVSLASVHDITGLLLMEFLVG